MAFNYNKKHGIKSKHNQFTDGCFFPFTQLLRDIGIREDTKISAEEIPSKRKKIFEYIID